MTAHVAALARIAGLEEALADALTGYSIAAFALDENDEALNAALGDKTAGIQRWRIMRLASERDAAIRRAEVAERDAELLWANCRVIYFASPSGSYPLEHSPLAWGVKDSREDIIAALRRDAAIAKEGER